MSLSSGVGGVQKKFFGLEYELKERYFRTMFSHLPSVLRHSFLELKRCPVVLKWTNELGFNRMGPLHMLPIWSFSVRTCICEMRLSSGGGGAWKKKIWSRIWIKRTIFENDVFTSSKCPKTLFFWNWRTSSCLKMNKWTWFQQVEAIPHATNLVIQCLKQKFSDCLIA